MTLATSTFWVLSFFTLWNLSSSEPMNCSDTSRLCTSFLAFKPNQNQTFSIIQSMFDALPSDITADAASGDVYVRKNCSCLTTTPHQYATNTTFTIRQNRGYVYDAVVSAYSGLAFPPNTTRASSAGAVVSVQLLCGCSSGLWNYLMSYVTVSGDSVQSLSSRFGVSMDRIEQVNGISNPDNVTTGDLIFIPLDSVPGVPYEARKINPPAPSPSPSPSPVLTNSNSSVADQVNHTSKGGHVPYIWIVGGLTVVLALLVMCILVCICLRSSSCGSSDEDGNEHNFQILRKSSFFCGSSRYNCCGSGDFRPTNGEETQSHHQAVAVPKALGDGVFSGTDSHDYVNSNLNRFNRNAAKNYRYCCSPTKMIHLSTLPQDVTEEEVVNHVQEHGAILNTKVFEMNGKKQALVQFENEEEAAEALVCKHATSLGGSIIRISFSQLQTI